jgi:hypothetical protein
MKGIFYFLLLIIILTSSCRRDNQAEYTKRLHEQLHGKYKAVNSVTSAVIDINGDGASSNYLLSEMDELRNCELVLLIVNKKEFLFYLMWPEQYLSPGTNVVNFACQGTARLFSIAADNVTLELVPDNPPLPDPDRHNFPDAVSIDGPNRVKVVLTKKLYTTNGWQTVTITTIYERYTMVP